MIEVVAGLIVDRGRLLLTQRTRDRDFSLMWESPGGKVEPTDPSPQFALGRELIEEIDQRVMVLPTAFFEVTFAAAHFPQHGGVHLTFYPCIVLPQSPPLALRDVAGAGWFTLAEMARCLRALLVPGNQVLLTHLLANPDAWTALCEAYR